MVKRLAITALLVLFFLSACTSPTKTNEVQDSPIVEATEIPPTDTATASPIPPTETSIPTETSTPAPTNTPAPVSYGPVEFPENINPLTGQEVIDPEIMDRRPISIKVQIFPRGQRPPMGVSQADIVFHYYQNSGMTRFHTIFYSKDSEQVGPIRSGRLLDNHLVSMYKSILVFGGADRRIFNRFYNSDYWDRLVFEGYGRCPPMCRIEPNSYNYLVADTSTMDEYTAENNIDNLPQNLDGMYFNAAVPEGGQPTSQVFIRFSISSYNRWDYDESSGRYLRFQDTVEAHTLEEETLAVMTDRNTGEQLTSDNVVILWVPHQYAFQTRPGLNEIIDINLRIQGSGQALALRNGQMYEVQWSRPEKDSVLILTYPDGTPYPFKPGNTWFEIVGQSSTLTSSPDGDSWRVQFSIP